MRRVNKTNIGSRKIIKKAFKAARQSKAAPFIKKSSSLKKATKVHGLRKPPQKPSNKDK